MLDQSPDTRVDTSVTGPFHNRDVLPCRSNGWACVYTHPQAERLANDSLRCAGYTTFLPLTLIRRRDRVLRTFVHTIEAPLFPRYLFLRFDHRGESWSPIRAMPGVHDLIRNGPIVQYASEADVSALQALRPPAAPEQPLWQPGTPCSLASGPLQGHPAVVLSAARETATLAVLLFGAIRHVSAPITALAARE